MDAKKLKHHQLTELILKGFYEVYNELGRGFLESVYENALALVLKGYGLKVECQKPITVYFRGQIVGDFRADIVVNDSVIVELKAVKAIDPAHVSQLLNYLKATDIEVGLLLNFGDKPEFKRLVYQNTRK
ncbi:MAG: GxxExxY protein [Methanobacteriota archaeon]|nr:MAG: GxxExxY protein [Euryarchaeota archaeon]